LTPGDRRLSALAALFAPARAPALLARAGGPGAARGVEHAARLASASRRERLAALATAIAVDAGAVRTRAEAAAGLERPRVGALLRALASGAPGTGASAPLVRLCRERMGR
jgi:hypothetical protein